MNRLPPLGPPSGLLTAMMIYGSIGLEEGKGGIGDPASLPFLLLSSFPRSPGVDSCELLVIPVDADHLISRNVYYSESE